MKSITRGALICICGLFLASVTYAAFSDSHAIPENTYTSAAVFPSAIQSPILLTITPSPVLPSLTPTPTRIQAGDVVINEINWAGSNDLSTDEWIELRNTTGVSILIGGWTVENLGSGTGQTSTIAIPSGSIIPPYGLFVISRLPQSESRMNVVPDWVTSSISLSNAGEQLRLRSATSVLVDTANASSGTWAAGSATIPRKSMERKLTPGDGTAPSSWQTATIHTGMDGSSPTDEYGTPGNQNGL